MAGINTRKCCCGCTDLFGGDCFICFPSGQVPRLVEMVFSGVAVLAVQGGSQCLDLGGIDSIDSGVIIGSPFNGSTGCGTWLLQQNPGASFNNRRFNSSTASGSTCAGGTVIAQHLELDFDVELIETATNPGGNGYVSARFQAPSGSLVYFSGRSAFVDCVDPIVLNNHTGPFTVNAASGGTCTIVFCPF